MAVAPFLRRLSISIGVIAALGAVLIAGVWSVARAQSQICRDTGNLTICGDTIEESGTQFRLRGNLRIGPKGSPAVVLVTDMATSFSGLEIGPNTYTAQFFHLDAPDPNTGAANFLMGSVRFIADTNTNPLIATHYVMDSQDNINVIAGRLWVDPIAKKISIPPPGGVPIFTQRNITRNSNMRFPYIDRGALRPFYREDGSTGEFATINGVFDLQAKTFNATMPINLKLTGNADNPNLQITLNAIFNSIGQFSGSVNAFKVVLGGLIVSVNNISLKAGEFTAATAAVSKADNPDLPPLDPTNAQLLFQFQNLKYKDGKFTIGGVTTPIKDWVFGDAFTMKNQSIGITNDEAAQTAFLTFNSTLAFGAATADGVQVPVSAKISRKVVNGVPKPILEATLQNVTPTIGALKFNLKGVTLTSDPVTDFFGLKAQTVDLQWPASLGGKTAAGITGFRLGINKAKKLQFSLAGGTIAAPEFQSGVLKGTLSGTVSVIQETVTFTLTGTLNVTLPSNSGVGTTANLVMRGGKTVRTSCQGIAPPCLVRYEEKLSAFNIKLAGFGVGLTNPRGLDDGGFAADLASFTLPPGIGTLSNFSGQIVGLRITGTGNVLIAGGGFELPPLKIGTVNFVGLKGSFAKDATGYKFTGGATLAMPGLEPANGRKISAQVSISTFADGSFKGFGVGVTFTARPGLPIGQTGMQLTTFSGSFNLEAGTAIFAVGLAAESNLKLLTLPVVTATGQASVQINPFKMTLGAQLKLLIFQVANASVTVGSGGGFNGGDGIKAQFTVNAVIVHGSAQLHAGSVKGQIDPATGKDRIAFTASANLAIAIKKGQFGFALPPFDLNIASLGLAGGNFVNDESRRTFGLKGQISVGPFSASLFVDMSRSLGQGGFVLLGKNAKAYNLISAAVARMRVAQGMKGYTIRTLAPREAEKRGYSNSASIQQLSIPITLNETATGYFGIHYESSVTPTISLQLPNGGTILTEANVNNTTQFFMRDLQPAAPAGGGNDIAFMLKGAAPGTYMLMIENPPADFTTVSYYFDNQPVLQNAQAQRNGTTVTVNFNASDSDSPAANVSISYVKVVSGSVELSMAQLLTDTLPLSTATYLWDLREVSTGQYKVVVSVDDGANAPTTQVLDLLVNWVDTQAPAVPTGLTATSLPGELLVNWNPNPEKDLAGYEIGFAEVNDVNQFVYTRDMGAKESGIGSLNAKLWGLTDNQTVYFGIRAYDYDGHFSAWSPLVAATPWELSPNAWTPTPDSTAQNNTRIEIAFETPLLPGSIANALTVQDANGAPVTGTQTPIYDLNGIQIIGLSFVPDQRLAGAVTYTVTLKGGTNGIATTDNRKMPQDYTWKFTTTELTIFLPMIQR